MRSTHCAGTSSRREPPKPSHDERECVSLVNLWRRAHLRSCFRAALGQVGASRSRVLAVRFLHLVKPFMAIIPDVAQPEGGKKVRPVTPFLLTS